MREQHELLKPDVLVFCLDFDGCTDTVEARDHLIIHIIKTALFHTNCRKVIITIASLRQSILLDCFNANCHYEYMQACLSCSVLGTDFIDKLQNIMLRTFTNKGRQPPIVEFNNLLTCDVYNNLEPGTTFAQMNGEVYQTWRQTNGPITLPALDEYGRCIATLNDEQYAQLFSRYQLQPYDLIHMETNEVIPREELAAYHHWRTTRQPVMETCHVRDRNGVPVSLFEWKKAELMGASNSIIFSDLSKIMMLWMFVNNIILKAGSDKIVRFAFVDDKTSLLDGVYNTFQKHSYMLPSTCLFQCMEMSTNDDIYPPYGRLTSCIQGTGVPNADYEEVMRHISRTLPNNCSMSRVVEALATHYKSSSATLSMPVLQSALSNAAHSTFHRPADTDSVVESDAKAGCDNLVLDKVSTLHI